MANNMGTVSIAIQALMANFESDMGRAARIAERDFKKIERDGKRMHAEIISGAKLAGAALGTMLVAGVAMYVRNTIEAEKVQAQLASRIKDTGAIAGRTLEQLNAQADALSRQTIFDDEAIGEVQAMLLTFRQIQGVNFDQAVATVLDLSTAMGVSAQDAAKQLGKALNDPILGVSALSKAGVQFTKDQKDVIRGLVEMGDVAGAQRLILAEFEGQMGTAAEAARNTLGGALQGLTNDFDNLLEGDTDGGGMKGTIASVNALSKTLQDPELKRGIDTLAEGLLKIANNAVIAAGKLGGLISQYRGWLASQGFLPTDDDSSFDELEKRRDKLQDMLARVESGRTVFGEGTADKLRAELAEIDRMLREFPVHIITGKADFSGVSGSARGSWERTGTASTGGGGAARQTAERDLAAAEAARERILNTDALRAAMIRKDDAELQGIRTLREGEAAAARMIDSMEFELSLIGMTNLERDKAIALRQLDAGATDEQIERMGRLVEEMQKANETQALLDNLKGIAVDFAVSAGSGFQSVGDAFEDMADRMKAIAVQLLAEKAIQWLLGTLFGTPASKGAEAQGSIFDLMSSDWGFAGGGYTGHGGKYQPAGIVHAGEYVINADSTRKLGRGFLDGLNSYADGGYVGAAAPMGAGPMQVQINNYGSDKVQTREETQRAPDGQMLRRLVVDIIASDLARGGKVDVAARQSYGLQRQGYRRG